jgi:hypothetical protein
MAWQIDVVGIPNPEQSGWRIRNITWWDYQELMEDKRFRDDECPKSRYHDYVTVLRLDTFKALHDKYQDKALSYQEKLPHLYGTFLDLKRHIQQAESLGQQWVMVQILEWG